MKFTTVVSFIDVIGENWYGQTCSMRYDLTSHDVENSRDGEGKLTHDSVERWLRLNSGDFQSIIDFKADIGHDEFTCDWSKEDSEYTWSNCMYDDAW